MSMNEHETHAEVVAEMRGTDNKCQFATKDGTGCYHCPFGSAASNCLFDKFADRAEAAHKREVEKLNSVIQATVSRSDAEIDRLRREVAELRKQIGNAAKMREALAGLIDGICFHCDMSGDCKGVPCEKMQNAKAALAAPARNCDVGTAEDQAQRFILFCLRNSFRGVCSDSCKFANVNRRLGWQEIGQARCFPFWAQMPYEEGGAK